MPQGKSIHRLLLVGPLPPPLGGTTVSFQTFCREVERYTDLLSTEVIDSSPKGFKKQTQILSLLNLRQAAHIFVQFSRRVASADQVVIFGSNGFILSMAPLLLGVAKLAGKPCYLRVFGGSFDQFYTKLAPMLRWFLLTTLRGADGLIVQTKLLYRFFHKLIGEKVHYVPGYRVIEPTDAPISGQSVEARSPIRLIFVGHVREEKGVFVLLDSLRKLAPTHRAAVQCDIYGPIYGSIAERFQREVAQVANASYRGVLPAEEVIRTLRQYDVLVFPTYYQGEGHPGVLIEALIAGIPVITVKFRSIPELIEDGVNGLLVDPKDADQLAAAILSISQDPSLQIEMGRRNVEKSVQYDARRVVPQMLQLVNLCVE